MSENGRQVLKGIAMETAYGEEGENVVAIEPIDRGPLPTVKSQVKQVYNARFDCPCCGEGISIKLETSTAND